MKRTIFERMLYDTPQWLIITVVYGIGGLAMFLLLFVL